MDQLLKNYEAATGRAQVGASIINAAMHRDAAMAAVQQDAAAQEQKMQLARAQMAQDAQGQQQQQDFRLALQDQQQQGDMALLERRFSLQQEQQLHELAGAEDYANQMLARAGNDPMARQTAQAWLQAVAARRYGISPSLLPRPPQTEVPPLFGGEQSASPSQPPQGIPGGGAGMMGSFVSAGPQQGPPGALAGMAGAFGGPPTPARPQPGMPQPQGLGAQPGRFGAGPFGPRSMIDNWTGAIYQQDPHNGMLQPTVRGVQPFNIQEANRNAARQVDQELAAYLRPQTANEQRSGVVRDRPYWMTASDPFERGLGALAGSLFGGNAPISNNAIAQARDREIARRVQQARLDYYNNLGVEPPPTASQRQGGFAPAPAPGTPGQEGGQNQPPPNPINMAVDQVIGQVRNAPAINPIRAEQLANAADQRFNSLSWMQRHTPGLGLMESHGTILDELRRIPRGAARDHRPMTAAETARYRFLLGRLRQTENSPVYGPQGNPNLFPELNP